MRDKGILERRLPERSCSPPHACPRYRSQWTSPAALIGPQIRSPRSTVLLREHIGNLNFHRTFVTREAKWLRWSWISRSLPALPEKYFLGGVIGDHFENETVTLGASGSDEEDPGLGLRLRGPPAVWFVVLAQLVQEMERTFREKGARFNGVLPVMKEDPDVIVIQILKYV